MNRNVQFMTIVGLVAVVGVVAQALPVDVRYISAAPAKVVSVAHPFSSGTSYNVGVYNLEVDFGDGNGPTAVEAFCVDLRQHASTSWQAYELNALEAAPVDGGTVYSPMGPLKANAIRELWGEHFADIAADNTNAAAFQLAVWEIIYENAPNQTPNVWDVASGNFAAFDAGATAVANSWLAGIGDAAQTFETTLFTVTNNVGASQYQDFVFSLDGGGTPPPVPEPMTTATVVAGLSALGAYVRRRTLA